MAIVSPTPATLAPGNVTPCSDAPDPPRPRFPAHTCRYYGAEQTAMDLKDMITDKKLGDRSESIQLLQSFESVESVESKATPPARRPPHPLAPPLVVSPHPTPHPIPHPSRRVRGVVCHPP